MINKDKTIEKWSTLIGDLTGNTSNWLDQYYQRKIAGDLTPEEWNATQPATQSNDSFNSIQFPIVKKISATTLGGCGWVKSEKQILKESRINKLRQLKGEEPNVKLPEDEYQDGLVSVQPMSAPKCNLFYMDYKYGDTEEEKQIKKQKIREEKLKYIKEILKNK